MAEPNADPAGGSPPRAGGPVKRVLLAGAQASMRAKGFWRRMVWAGLALLMVIFGGVAACQAPGWLGPSHHEPSLGAAEAGRS